MTQGKGVYSIGNKLKILKILKTIHYLNFYNQNLFTIHIIQWKLFQSTIYEYECKNVHIT